MRTIKFRGLRTDGKGWVYGDLVRKYGKTFIVTETESISFGRIRSLWIEIEILPESVGQFTGLTDIFENQIFEGDVLEFPFELGIAYVINDGFRFAVKSPGSQAIDYEPAEVLIQTKVIGNIHQNKDLL
jgi:uncharacterized phage protein (TIGR01671 family)